MNQTFARMLYGNSSPIGQKFALWATAQYQIVGEVEDGKYHSVGEKPEPLMMMPLAQGIGGHLSTAATLLVRSQLPQDQVASALHRMLIREVPGTPFTVRSWSDSVDLSLIPLRAITMVLAVMGLLAAVLAMTGIFGMASYSVARRMKEQGIRIALGAQPSAGDARSSRPAVATAGLWIDPGARGGAADQSCDRASWIVGDPQRSAGHVQRVPGNDPDRRRGDLDSCATHDSD